MRIATWNVNSLKQRLPRLLPWLDQRQPDVVCLQETKLADNAFSELLGDQLSERGYEAAAHGEAAWNGVAILSRVGLDDVVAGIDGAPGFPNPEARAVSATCDGIRVVSVYVPNGRIPDSDHYRYKLAWLASLRDAVAAGPKAVVVCGDMNIAPTDEDVFDPDAYVGQTHVTRPERTALAELEAVGLNDVVRDRWPGKRVFTYWDYRAGMFHQDLGMRIDLVLAGDPVARARQGRMGRSPGPQGHWPERSRTGDRRPRRGTGRGHRAGGSAAVQPGDEARREEAAPGVLTLDRMRLRFCMTVNENRSRKAAAVRFRSQRGRSRSRDGWTRFGSPGILG